jgi:cytochrome c553
MKRRIAGALEIVATVALMIVVTALDVLVPRRPQTTDAVRATERPSPPGGAARRWLFRTAVVLGVLGIGGSLVVVSGIVPIKASSGHWPITAWVLQFARTRSVATHTLGVTAPPLDDASLILKGAMHYDIGCRPCHGSPELRRPRIAQGMTPSPPYLPSRIPNQPADDLFYIVKHGVKFTGMPAWPAAQRDDEVWAVVAFLRRFPTLTEDEYRRLVGPDVVPRDRVEPLPGSPGADEVPRAVLTSCGRCHGGHGGGRGVGAFPRLAGQRPAYLFAALRAYARGERHSGIMEPIAAGLSGEEMRALAVYYARLAMPPESSGMANDAIERGRAISERGIPSQRVPSCRDCHGPAPVRRNAYYPVLAGQYAEYLSLQLRLFGQQHRGGTSYAHLMRPVAQRLTPEQMRDVALYYASLAPAPDGMADDVDRARLMPVD